MRTVALLAAVTMLAGCNAAPKTPQGPVIAKAGQWRETQTYVSITGVPPGEKPPPLNQPRTSEKCLNAIKMPDAIWQQTSIPPNLKIDGNRFSGESPPQTTRDEVTNEMMTIGSKLEGSFTDSHYEITVTLTMNLGPKAPNVVSTMHATGDYVGPCPPDQTAPLGNDNDSMSAPSADTMAMNAAPDPSEGMMNAQ